MARKPVLLKRGIAATIEELLLSAEYIFSGGNYDVILCERGIRTYETYTRNTMDVSAIPVVKHYRICRLWAILRMGLGGATWCRRWRVAAVAAGGDGLLIEVHPNPDKAASDGAQSLFPEQFAKLMDELRIIAPAVGRTLAQPVAAAVAVDATGAHCDFWHGADWSLSRACVVLAWLFWRDCRLGPGCRRAGLWPWSVGLSIFRRLIRLRRRAKAI